MRLHEVFGIFEADIARLNVVSTDTFDRAFMAIKETLPARVNGFKQFLEYRVDNALKPYGSNDRPFKGRDEYKRMGLYHYHLEHGKIIVVYFIKQGAIHLVDIVKHDAYEQSLSMKLDTEFHPFTLLDETPAEPVALPMHIGNGIKDIVWTIVASPNHEPLIKEVLSGNVAPVMDDLILPLQDDDQFAHLPEEQLQELVFNQLGGKEGIANLFRLAMKQMGRRLSERRYR